MAYLSDRNADRCSARHGRAIMRAYLRQACGARELAVAPLFLRRNALRLLRPTGCSAPLREERSLCSGRARRGPECAALRPGHETGPRVRCSRHCECIPIPVPTTSLILLASCPVRGASRGVTEVGQSESLAGAG